ncbi:hypothetical protein BD309DRAFT_955764 [Dichomitus squalens]|nr:hypothetical protein BD309DRAFT_955764 [Dichomitus squalens]
MVPRTKYARSFDPSLSSSATSIVFWCWTPGGNFGACVVGLILVEQVCAPRCSALASAGTRNRGPWVEAYIYTGPQSTSHFRGYDRLQCMSRADRNHPPTTSWYLTDSPVVLGIHTTDAHILNGRQAEHIRKVVNIQGEPKCPMPRYSEPPCCGSST